MTWLLDTNVCVGLLRGRAPKTAAKLQTVPRAEVTLCSVVIYELHLGTEKCSQPATESAKVRAELEKAGTPIGPYDYQIAAIGQHHGLTVVTRNVSEFTRVHGLKVEDWES